MLFGIGGIGGNGGYGGSIFGNGGVGGMGISVSVFGHHVAMGILFSKVTA